MGTTLEDMLNAPSSTPAEKRTRCPECGRADPRPRAPSGKPGGRPEQEDDGRYTCDKPSCDWTGDEPAR